MIDQLLTLVRTLTISQRIGIVFGAALTVLMTVGLVVWAGQPQMQAAFTNVPTSDAATITTALTSAGIPYTLDNGGSTISVPSAKVAEAKIAANQAGYSGADASGFDIFNQQAIGASAFDQQVQLQRAIQNTLATNIKKFAGVADATVTIVFAKNSVTTSTDQPASASVLVKMAGGAEPDAELVNSIVSTVSGAVPSLDSANVSVVDTTGKTLAGPNNEVSSALNLQATTERAYRTKIQTLLDAVLGGAGLSQVQITASLDMSKTDQTTTKVAPVSDQSNFTPTGWQISVESYGGSGSGGSGGIPGTTSNVPGLPTYPTIPTASANPSASPGASATPTASPSGSASPYQKSDVTVNIANSTDVTKTTKGPGTVLSLAGAVFVNEAALTKAGLDAAKLETIIETAVGAPKGLIPTTAVKTLADATTNTAVSAPGPIDMLPGILPTVGGAMLALALLFLVYRNMTALRGRAEEMQLAAARMSMPALAMGEMGTTSMSDSPLGMLGFQEESVPALPESPQAKIGERLRVLAEENPDEVAKVVGTWLNDDERATRRR